VRDTVDAFALFVAVLETTARPLLFDQCGSFIPACFLHNGQRPLVDCEFVEYVDRLVVLAAFPDRQLSQI
jgi:hypothetical protein